MPAHLQEFVKFACTCNFAISMFEVMGCMVLTNVMIGVVLAAFSKSVPVFLIGGGAGVLAIVMLATIFTCVGMAYISRRIGAVRKLGCLDTAKLEADAKVAVDKAASKAAAAAATAAAEAATAATEAITKAATEAIAKAATAATEAMAMVKGRLRLLLQPLTAEDEQAIVAGLDALSPRARAHLVSTGTHQVSLLAGTSEPVTPACTGNGCALSRP